MQGVRVSIGEWYDSEQDGVWYEQFWGEKRQAWTDGDGNYAVFNVGRYSLRFFPPVGDEKPLRAQKAGMRFEPLFANPVYFPQLPMLSDKIGWLWGMDQQVDSFSWP